MSGCKTVETTNELLSEVLERIDTLSDWANADAEHAEENGAPETAKDDRWRYHQLRTAREILEGCER